MNESENSNILLLNSINISDINEIINYYLLTWKESNKNYITNKDFYLELNEELDSYKLLPRFKALSKLFKCLINTDIIATPLSIFENSKNLLNKEEICKAYEFGIFESLTSNLSYLYSKFIAYNENYFNIEKCELIFFTKINTYLLYVILFLFQNDTSMIKHIKYSGDLLEETILKFIKQYTHKYVPIRMLLSLYTLFFSVLLSDIDTDINKVLDKNQIIEEKNNNSKKKEKYLTKQNYLKYLKPEIPLIFLSAYSQNNKDYCIEKFYRRNLIMQQKSDIEMIFISQILKILLITFTNSKNPEANLNRIEEHYSLFFPMKTARWTSYSRR